ncbi:hypothetical protein AAT19DRAFT_12659 [Rhodotorula toruloides]|uniref:Uncharacterized protein n=1 Tax=Rhodotorula toruloides TaxID=5286 RepID=A0A2T0AGV0_RHOTO|nr:hypothetical protein AAT19DRAFT_12659 [Rhodotorula toruloides]
MPDPFFVLNHDLEHDDNDHDDHDASSYDVQHYVYKLVHDDDSPSLLNSPHNLGGAAALIALGLLGWWFAKKGGRSQKDEYDPFARDEHWDPALGGAGAAAGAGAVAAGRSNRLSRHGAHPRHSKYAEAGYGVAGAGAGALGYAATHERSRSRDSSGEGEKDGFPSYAPLPTDGSPQRVKRKVAPAAEQDAYYAHVPYYQSQGARQDDGMTMASVGTGAAGVGALGAASMYDRHHYEQQQAPQLPEIPVERDSYGAGGAMSPPPGGLANSPSPPPQHAQQGYAMSPPPQHNTAGVGVYPSMYSQGQGQAYGQPGGYMQYSSSTSPPPGAPSYPTMYGSAAPSYPPQHASLPYPGAIDYGPSATPQQQRDLAPPASLVPGVAPSPAPSYRSIQHLDEPTQQQQRSSPLRVVNEDEEQQRFGGEGEVDAYGGLDEGLAYLAPERR